jgi:hypothetical protein
MQHTTQKQSGKDGPWAVSAGRHILRAATYCMPSAGGYLIVSPTSKSSA